MLPTIFLAHGAPPLLDEAAWMAELGAWAREMPRPHAVLVLSAHWEALPVTLGATTTVPLVYDFYGFPQSYYAFRYPAPGAPDLAARVRAVLTPTMTVRDDPGRGLDHGVWVPLLPMYPDADVPVLQVSLPSLAPERLFDLGRKLAPLRHEGVLIIGSGFITHNLRAVDWAPDAPVPGWAQEFDAWTADAVVRHDVDGLLDYRQRAPGVRQALPTHEHFAPLIAAVGAATGPTVETPAVRFPITGFWLGSLTRRSIQLG